ncbi:MAG: oligosaccharide flippase family protein [Sphingomonas sp.]|uniref:oligosaccharide flippase family protein n=1 Tax=Sphingomonas sp. TaxID=28214 RepID=UPI0026001B8C|nr:oligosaccharide flippase family protein [Sphingomonas sp.]MBY0284877.1 oligosaccharide flippase family protein [Sphingomonas sp.]
MQAKVLSNAIWNAINGSSSAVVAVLVPPFLTRLLTPEAYGAWALALQIGTYVSLFGFGIQMAVGRYVAYHEAREDYAARDGIVATAFWFLACASVIGWLAICGVALTIEWLVPNLAPELVGQTRWAIVLVGLALAINLPSSVFAAVFTGMQKSDVPAKIQGLGRLALALGLVIAGLSRNLGVLGLVYAIISIGTVAGLAYAWRTRTHAPELSIGYVAKKHVSELASFCFSLTIWNFAMLLISGLDLLIVGRYDYAATPYYAVSASLAAVINGILGSLANALVPPIAKSYAEGAHEDAMHTVESASRFILSIAVVASSIFIFCARDVADLWLGKSYGYQSSEIIMVLATATLIRSILTPYVSAAIATGGHRSIAWTPIIEGIANVSLSVWLGSMYGLAGILTAKVVSAFVGIGLVLYVNPLRNVFDNYDIVVYIRSALYRPLAAILIISLIVIPADYAQIDRNMGGVLYILLVLSVSSIACFFVALDSADRKLVIQQMNELRSRGSKMMRHFGGM